CNYRKVGYIQGHHKIAFSYGIKSKLIQEKNIFQSGILRKYLKEKNFYQVRSYRTTKSPQLTSVFSGQSFILETSNRKATKASTASKERQQTGHGTEMLQHSGLGRFPSQYTEMSPSCSVHCIEDLAFTHTVHLTFDVIHKHQEALVFGHKTTSPIWIGEDERMALFHSLSKNTKQKLEGEDTLHKQKYLFDFLILLTE
ncbi:hypothetical protein STEG23_014767, partial [Scotinomys teguina]